MSCPDCTTGGFLLGEPAGTMSTMGAYFSPNPTNEQPSNKAILLLTDAFGLPLKNCKIIADNLAKRLACDVWVPDIFNGNPLFAVDQLALPSRAWEKISWTDSLKFYYAVLKRIPALISSRPSIVDERIAKFIEAIKADRKYEKLGVVGFCFGGTMTVRVGGTGLVHSLVICHPGGFTMAQVKAIKAPASWVCAEDDFTFPRAKRLQCEAMFAERSGKPDSVPYEFVDYKGTAHGFATRPNLTLPDIKEAHEKAVDQMVNWFSKTLDAK